MQSISEENYEKPISETNHFNLVTISKENTVSISINCLRCKSTLIAARNTQTNRRTHTRTPVARPTDSGAACDHKTGASTSSISTEATSTPST